MKNTTITRQAPRRLARNRPRPGLQTRATPRRPATDFLALAFYPGMTPPAPILARVTAA